MKNHFVSTIGVDYDLDLAPHWIDYYKQRDFDSMTVFLHREKGNIPEILKRLYRDNGFTVFCVDGPYSGGRAGAFFMQNFINNLPENDFVTVADADEFQCMNDGSPIPYKALCEGYDILHGLFEERYTDSLEACVKDPFLQYQYVEPYTGDYLKSFCPPYLEHIEWPQVLRSKIIAARAGESYRYWGMHGIEGISFDAKILFNLKVVHFCWREGAAKKLLKKDWYKKVGMNDRGELIPVEERILETVL